MTTIIVDIARLLVYDLVFLGVIILALIPLAVFKKASYAILKRNFVGYFSNPTGYVFLIIFVVLTSILAFCPHEFFNSNMATLHQLNWSLPFIMLIFVPAITMSIWAEERREGTDELLLTIPASDVDVVLGKYLAAGFVFTASLIYSQIISFSVLSILSLGNVDMGLFLTTYLGYWLLGLGMLSIGMVASFLTKNLTVAFVLGGLFNAPLVAAALPDVIVPQANVAQVVSQWSLSSQLEDFGRGVMSISSTTYFVLLIVIGIYLSIVLVGRRHWLGGRDGHSMFGHYLVRMVALFAFAVFLSLMFNHKDIIRIDATSEQVSSLSDATHERLNDLNLDRTIYVEAYISKTLPEAYVKTKYELVTLLREIEARGGGKIRVVIHDNMEPFSEEAKEADERYGIRPVTVRTVNRGSFTQEQIFLASVFSCGLERVTIPFFGQGSSVEYELVRSIATVADAVPTDEEKAKADDEKKGDTNPRSKSEEEKKPRSGRRTIGIVRTDAQIMGTDESDFMAMMHGRVPPQALVEQLQRQYEVETVDPNSEIDTEQYDALLVVQPSSLTQPQMDNLADAIRKGLPTALFEDPLPVQFRPPSAAGVVGTDQPKPPQGGMFGMQPRMPEPKGDFNEFQKMLGIKLVRAKQATLPTSSVSIDEKITWQPHTAVVWQDYNPYPKVRGFGDAVVFANPNAIDVDDLDKTRAFNPDELAVSGLHEVAFLTPGAIEERTRKTDEASKLRVIDLVKLGRGTGLLAYDRRSEQESVLIKPVTSDLDDKAEEVEWTGELRNLVAEEGRLWTGEPYTLAVRIRTRTGDDEKDSDKERETDDKEKKDGSAAKSAGKSDEPKIDVMFIADIDVLESTLLTLRDQPSDIDFKFQNLAFVLNVLDMLAGDMRFVEIRKRQVSHASLRLIENRIRKAREEMIKSIEEFEAQINKEREEAEEKAQDLVDDLQSEVNELQAKGELDRRRLQEAREKLALQEERNKADTEDREDQLKRRLQAKLEEEERQLNLDKKIIEDTVKLLAVTIPPILPLLVGLAVFAVRIVREREGVGKERLRG